MDVKLTRLPSLLPVHAIFWVSGRFVLLHPLDVEHRGAGPLVRIQPWSRNGPSYNGRWIRRRPVPDHVQQPCRTGRVRVDDSVLRAAERVLFPPRRHALENAFATQLARAGNAGLARTQRCTIFTDHGGDIRA
jgi:hypothetical protein